VQNASISALNSIARITKNVKEKVYINGYLPDNIIETVKKKDYLNYAKKELKIRNELNLYPTTNMIKIISKASLKDLEKEIKTLKNIRIFGSDKKFDGTYTYMIKADNVNVLYSILAKYNTQILKTFIKIKIP
jgi:primosomal protein N'